MSESKLSAVYEPAAPLMSERKKQAVLERLWLTYFNYTLYAQGVISEAEHTKMRIKIKNRAISAER